jgi:hypothetical protein
MKKSPQSLKRESQVFGVNYRWTDANGIQCGSRTATFGRDRAQAERRFFNRNRQVQPETEVVK